jgi:ubiquitin conjugation factor E4 B
MEKLSGPAKPKQTPEETAEADTVTTSSPSATTPKPTTPEQAELSKPKINIKPAAVPAAGSDNPFTKLTSRPSSGTPPVRSTSAASLKRPLAESVEQGSASAPPRKTATPAGNEDIDTWENRILGQIFRFTLDPNQKIDASNHKLIYLPNLRKELEDEDAPIRLSQDKLSDAIAEAASTVPHNKPVLDYLLPCWKRVIKALKGLRGYKTAKDGILKEAKRLCMSNCIFAITLPELFG